MQATRLEPVGRRRPLSLPELRRRLSLFFPRNMHTDNAPYDLPVDRVIQATIHRWLCKACAGFTAAPMRFVSLANGGFFVAPGVRTLHLRIDARRCDVSMSGDAAGIVATLMSLSELCGHANRRFDDVAALTYSDYYHRLHAFASEHAESHAILAAVD